MRAGFAESVEFAQVVSHVCTVNASSSGGQSVPRDGAANLTYDSTNNHVTNAGYAYDAAGNQLHTLNEYGTGQRYVYDAANRMVQVVDDTNRYLASYTYGEGNERLISEESGYRTYYVGSMAEYGESNGTGVIAWTKSYVYLGARLLATLTPNGSGGESTQYHHPDRLGTRLITNAGDTNYFEQASLPYGTALDAESSGATNRRFTSYDRSASTGLDYAINRHYDAQQGRFTQADPLGMGASSLADPQSLNMYAYVGGDPVNRTDPDGLFWGKLFKSLFKRVVNALIHAAIHAVIVFITTGSPHAALVAGIATFVRELGFPSKDSIGVWKGTPPFNPNAAAVLSSGAGGLNKYIIYNLQGDDNYCSQCHVETTYDVIDKMPGEAWYRRYGRALGDAVSAAIPHIGAVAVGFADNIPIIRRFPKWARRQLGVDDKYEKEIENSWDYTVGQGW